MHATFETLQPAQWLKLFGYARGWTLDRLGVNTQELMRLQELYGPDLLGRVDGYLGPKTRAAMAMPRCPFPDEFDEELARHVNDPVKVRDLLAPGMDISDVACICAAHAKGLESSGSWPESCAKQLKVHIDTSRAPSWMDVDEIFEWSVARYAEVGVGLVRTDNRSEAHIRQSFRGGRGWIGLAEFNGGYCGDSVFNYRDPGYNGGDTQNKNLDLHELCHNMNGRHTRGGIMNPTISPAQPYWVRWDERGNIIHEDPSYRTLKRYFPWPPLDGPDPEPPEPPKPPEPEPEPPDVNIPWSDVIAIVIELIQGCGESRSVEQIRNPGLVQKLRLRRKLRDRMNLSRREWRQHRDAINQQLEDAIEQLTDEDAQYLLEEAGE